MISVSLPKVATGGGGRRGGGERGPERKGNERRRKTRLGKETRSGRRGEGGGEREEERV